MKKKPRKIEGKKKRGKNNKKKINWGPFVSENKVKGKKI